MSDYMKEAERLLSEYGDAVSDAVVFAQDPSGYSMRMEEATRAALLAHIQRGAVPEGWQLVPKEPTPEMLAGGWGYWLNVMAPGKQRDTAAKEYAAMLAAAPAPDQFRDAAKMMAEPAEVPMPEPIGFIDSNDEETWATLTQNAHELATLKLRSTVFHVSQMRTYGDACEAAGYARGLRDAVRDADIEALRLYVRALCKAVDAATDFAGTVAGGASWWDDVWADHAAALDRARERISQAALRGEVK